MTAVVGHPTPSELTMIAKSNQIVDFTEIPSDGEDWEAFTRDFLVALGFTVESPPDRGADGGKDMLVVEHLPGRLSSYSFRWLVSCKHFAKSQRAVAESDEQNVLERLASFRADGFLGIYSTLATSGLNTRLRALRNEGKVRDYKVFDARLIENQLLQVGYSQLMMQFMPESYRRAKPLHILMDEYVPLPCRVCHKDLLDELNRAQYTANVILGRREQQDGGSVVETFDWCCKGDCNDILDARLQKRGLTTGWEDISDLVIPVWYLKWIMATLNRMRSGLETYSNSAFTDEKEFLIALGQKVFRDSTAEERKRMREVWELSKLGI